MFRVISSKAFLAGGWVRDFPCYTPPYALAFLCKSQSTGDYDCGENGYACIDPEAPCVDDDDVTVEMVESCGNVQGFGEQKCLASFERFQATAGVAPTKQAGTTTDVE